MVNGSTKVRVNNRKLYNLVTSLHFCYTESNIMYHNRTTVEWYIYTHRYFLLMTSLEYSLISELNNSMINLKQLKGLNA